MKKYIVLFIFILILALSLPFVYVSTKNTIQSKRATKKGEVYIKELYKEYTILGNVCQGEDTDNDAYVSCDFRIKNSSNDGGERTISIQCPTFWKSFLGTSCKQTRGIISQ